MPNVFELGGVAIALEAPAEDRAWLAGFGGCLERPEREAAPFHVAFEPSSGTLPAADAAAATRIAFALDAGPLRLPAVERDGGVRLWDAASGSVVDVTEGGRATRIRTGGDPLAARLLLLRVVREYAHNQALADGDLVLHAAGLVHEGRALVIAGAKGAGKTTRALRLMAGGHRYLANDRVRVRLAPTPEAIGIPTVVTLRSGTLRLFRDLEARLRRCGDYRGSAGPAREDAAGLRVSPAQLCAAFGQEPAASAPLGSLVVLGGEATVASLAGCLVGQASGVHASDVFRPWSETAVPDTQLRARVERLAALVPCVRERR